MRERNVGGHVVEQPQFLLVEHVGVGVEVEDADRAPAAHERQRRHRSVAAVERFGPPRGGLRVAADVGADGVAPGAQRRLR